MKLYREKQFIFFMTYYYNLILLNIIMYDQKTIAKWVMHAHIITVQYMCVCTFILLYIRVCMCINNLLNWTYYLIFFTSVFVVRNKPNILPLLGLSFLLFLLF